jgi:hypothetical protein
MQLSRLTAAPFHGQNRPMTFIRRTRPLLAAAGFFALLAAGSNSWGQEDTIYIGGAAQRGTVHVDMSVLDELGGGGLGRQVLQPPAPRGPARTTTHHPEGPARRRRNQAAADSDAAGDGEAPAATTAPRLRPQPR